MFIVFSSLGLLSCIELYIFLCRLVLFTLVISFVSKGFPLQLPDCRVIYCNGLLHVFPARNIINFLRLISLFKLQHTYQMHDIADLC